jgi:hypothetical protein
MGDVEEDLEIQQLYPDALTAVRRPNYASKVTQEIS